MQEIEQLLKVVAFQMETLRKDKNRFSAQLAPDFRIFDYLRTDEMGLSKCIASLLDPNGTHGQGRVFLTDFLKMAGPAWATTSENCEVGTEKQANGQRRIDIYLNFQDAGIIGIENNPWAGDQDRQLSDYASHIEKAAGGKKWLLIYLSNSDPSEISITTDERELLQKFGHFLRLDYADVIRWLEYCASQSKALVVRVFIEELAKFIRIKVNGELDMSEENEACNVILKSPESLSSAFHIIKAIDAVKERLLVTFRENLKKLLEENKFELVWDSGMDRAWESQVGFGVKFKDQNDFYLRFEFGSPQLKGLYWGIYPTNHSVKANTNFLTNVNSVMNGRFMSARGEAKRFLWWSWINTVEKFGESFRNWDKNEKPWVSMINRDMEKEIIELAKSVHSAFIGDDKAPLSKR